MDFVRETLSKLLERCELSNVVLTLSEMRRDEANTISNGARIRLAYAATAKQLEIVAYQIGEREES